MVFTAYIHYTCPASRHLLQLFKDTGLYNILNIVDAGSRPFDAFSHAVLSVPMLFADSQPVAAGEFDPEKLKSYLSLFTTEIPDDDTLFRKLVSASTDNVGTAAQVFLYEDPDLMFQNTDYLFAVTGLIYTAVRSREEFLEKLKRIFTERFPQFISEKPYLYHKVIALNFLRETSWLHGKSLSPDELNAIFTNDSFVHWMYTRSAIGRAGIRTGETMPNIAGKAALVWDYLIKNYAELVPIAERTA